MGKADLDNIVYQSPLSFFDPHNRYRCEIRVNRGIGVLLNGQVVHITDMNTKAFAPAILPVVDEPYVAIEDSVVLYLDFNRSDYHSEKTSRLNPKLAKLMGLSGQASVVPNDESLSDINEDEEMYTDDDDKEEEDDYNEQERQLLAGDKDVKTVTIADETTNADQPIVTRL